MLDRYSKVVLTIIAGALSVIAWNGLNVQSATAQAGSICGSAKEPCYIQNAPSIPIFTVVSGEVSVAGPVHLIEPVRVEMR